MKIGFFADGTSASHAALLASSALNRHDPYGPEILAGSHRIVGAVAAYLDHAAERTSHLMVALPLAHLGDASIRSRLDLAVITSGSGPLARHGARRAMDSEDARPSDLMSPPWLLAAAGRTRRSDEIRILPIDLEPLRPDQAGALRAGCSCSHLNRRSIGLAAALRIAADDPYAPRIDPADAARVLVAPATAAEFRLRDDLLDLASDLDNEGESDASIHRPRSTQLAGQRPRRPSGRPRRMIAEAPGSKFAFGRPDPRHCACPIRT